MVDLVDVILDGAIRALALHAGSVDKAVAHSESLKAIIRSEYPGLINQLKDASDAHMGEFMYRNIINVWCNAWAVKALEGNIAH